MPHSLHFLQEHCQAGSEKMLARGYRWFSNTFIPTLKKTSEVSSDTFLVAEAWLLVGEVYELLHAPLQALTCYQIGLHFNPEESDLYRWKALVEEQLGNYVAALSSIEKAVQYTNEAEDLMIDRQRIQDCLVYDKTPEFEEGDLVWECNEQLTNDEFEAVLQITNPAQTSNIERLKCAYRAYGALQEMAKGEALWQRILRLDSHATLSEIDLFYWS
ncbi:MAG: tetratricopeptide repeat protein [Bacteroidota bacterium]